MNYTVEYFDPTNGTTSQIDTITAPEGYTAQDYIDGCRENADPDWVEMLERGIVSLTATVVTVFEGYDKDNQKVRVELEDGMLFVLHESGEREVYNEEQYTEESDFSFLLNEFRK